MRYTDGRDSPKDGGVGQLVFELVHGHGHVSRLLRTAVKVPAMEFQNITEDFSLSV